MKDFLITLVFFSLIGSAYSQPPENKWSGFYKYVGSNYKVPNKIKADCYFNYITILMDVNKNEKVIGVEVLNDVSEEVRNSVRFLVGYQFDGSLNLAGKSALFFILFDQQNSLNPDCSTSYSLGITPATVFGLGLKDIAKQLRKKPNTYINYRPLIIELYSPIIN